MSGDTDRLLALASVLARVEREREVAVALLRERDAANFRADEKVDDRIAERDRAVAERDALLPVLDRAHRRAEELEKERDAAFAELDRARDELVRTRGYKEGFDQAAHTARTKRAVNSLTIERGSKVVSHE